MKKIIKKLSKAIGWFLRCIASVYFILLFIGSSLIFSVIGLIIRAATQWCDPNLRALHYFSCFWAGVYTWLNPLWDVRIKGRSNIPAKGAFVLVSNHQSLADILVLFRIFRQFKWVAKESLFRVPLVGWNLYLNRYVRIGRNSVSSQRRMMRRCTELLAGGSSIMIFPEGTRSKDGQLRSFKEGAFYIAQEQKTDIIPMVIDGSAGAFSKSFFPFNRQVMRLRIMPSVPYERFAALSAQEAGVYVRGLMAEELESLRQGR